MHITTAQTGQSAIDGQLAGKYDITSADYVTYIDDVLLKKSPLRIIGESSFLQPNVLTLLTKPGSAVTTVQGLKGQQWAQQNPNTLAAFERAYAQGQELADTDRADVEKAVVKYLQLTPQAAALISLPEFPTGVDATRLQRLVDAMIQYGLLNKK